MTWLPPRNGSIRQFVTARISLRGFRSQVESFVSTDPTAGGEKTLKNHLAFEKRSWQNIVWKTWTHSYPFICSQKKRNLFKKRRCFFIPFTHFTPCKWHVPRHPMCFPRASTSSLCCALQQAKWATLSRKAAFNLPEGRKRRKDVGRMKFRFGTEKPKKKLWWSYLRKLQLKRAQLWKPFRHLADAIS